MTPFDHLLVDTTALVKQGIDAQMTMEQRAQLDSGLWKLEMTIKDVHDSISVSWRLEPIVCFAED